MAIGEICTREVVIANRDVTVKIAAHDIVTLLAEEMSGLATMISREHKKEAAERRTFAPDRD